MKKKLMAVAVAGALAGPGAALAQSSTVNLYGLIVQHVTVLDQGGNRLKTDLQGNHDAGIGFRGEERLGGNLSAWFQCESTLDLNAGGTATWCGRNSAVGFKGSFGNIFAGLWNTPLRDLIHIPLRPVIAPGGGTSEILFNADALAGNNVTNAGAQFGRRPKNIIQYWSPNWGGFEFRGAVTTTNEATGQTTTSVAAKPRMWTVAGRYVNGPFYVAGGYESHKNYNPINLVRSPAAFGAYQGGDDRMWQIAAQYTFAGSVRLIGMYQDLEYEVNPGVPANLDAKTWALYAYWQIAGPHRVSGGYSKLRDTSGSAGCGAAPGTIAPIIVGSWTANCGLGGTGAKYYQLQYGYSFSKRTEVYFGWAKNDNDPNAALRVAIHGGGVNPPSGVDQTAWTLGVRHSF